MAKLASSKADVIDIGSEDEQDRELLTITIDEEKFFIEPDQDLLMMLQPMPGMNTGRYIDKGFTQERFIVYA